jgi:hypothetical protein
MKIVDDGEYIYRLKQEYISIFIVIMTMLYVDANGRSILMKYKQRKIYSVCAFLDYFQ